jgi:hypothetical protein
MDENAHARLGVIKFDFDGEACGVQKTTPVIGRDGNEMGVLEERDECCQNTILGVLRSKGLRHTKKRADKETALRMDTRHHCNHPPSALRGCGCQD